MSPGKTPDAAGIERRRQDIQTSSGRWVEWGWMWFLNRQVKGARAYVPQAASKVPQRRAAAPPFSRERHLMPPAAAANANHRVAACSRVCVTVKGLITLFLIAFYAVFRFITACHSSSSRLVKCVVCSTSRVTVLSSTNQPTNTYQWTSARARCSQIHFFASLPPPSPTMPAPAAFENPITLFLA